MVWSGGHTMIPLYMVRPGRHDVVYDMVWRMIYGMIYDI